jgi:hypothetical protein
LIKLFGYESTDINFKVERSALFQYNITFRKTTKGLEGCALKRARLLADERRFGPQQRTAEKSTPNSRGDVYGLEAFGF